MKRGCDPELNLQLGSGIGIDSTSSTASSKSTEQMNPQPPQQQVTIFYDGKMCVCDVTEFQAKAIICMAMREMEERSPRSQAASPRHHIGLQMISNPGMSMKRSLQRFLQKRKTRLDAAASPYSRAAQQAQSIV